MSAAGAHSSPAEPSPETSLRTLAILRNLALSAIRHTGWKDIASGLRKHTRNPHLIPSQLHLTCHSLRALRVGDKPSRLLRAVRGIDLVELPSAETCCGFGGTFAVKNADTSTAMLADKITHITATRAEFLCAADNSCLMHIGGGLSRLRTGTRPIHLAGILAATEEDTRI